MRSEKDALGELMLPDDACYGIQTARALENFAVSGQTVDQFPQYVCQIALIKKAAALANRQIGALDPVLADAICRAADEIIEGKMKGQFPIDMLQGGGGTSTNMNVNEVIANRANEMLTGRRGNTLIHPNTHVNQCQSTNDVIPAAIKMTCFSAFHDLIGQLDAVEAVLSDKASQFSHVVKIGRTCLQDAVPLTLGQELGGSAHYIRRQKKNLLTCQAACLDLPLGATAVGTGIGTRPGYTAAVFHYLNQLTGLAYKQEADLFDGLQNGDLYLSISGGLKTLATGLSKMATDLRILSSGPRAGLAELRLPAVQPGSSIMPGKINPVIPELVNQVCYQICGYDLTVTMAVEGGELDLNIWEPVIARSLFESFRLLTSSLRIFCQKCLIGIEADEARCRRYADASLALATVIATSHGYETGSKVARFAAERQITIAEAAVLMGLYTEEEARIRLDPIRLTQPEQE